MIEVGGSYILMWISVEEAEEGLVGALI